MRKLCVIGCTKTERRYNILEKTRYILRRYRRLIGAAAFVFAAAAILWAVTSPAVVGAAAASRELPIYCVQRDNKAVALSFDAAWADV